MYSSSYYRYIHINLEFIISHNKKRSVHTNLVFVILQNKVRSFVICFGYYIYILYKNGNPVTDFASPIFIT
jgi:hypothetical protein